jgi:uncharacterized protein YdeI (YjbR/CyaY-like superfamily)
MIKKNESEMMSFESPKAWARWLEANHDTPQGIWLRFFKKDSGIKTVSYAEALDEALCYGWIDGQVKKNDEKSWLQKFTPRRPKSMWSKRNTDHVARLTELGRMKPSGLQEVEAAKADGRWQKAYDSPGAMTVPEDFLQKLSKNVKSMAFYTTLNKANLYAIAWHLQTAKKPETREKRMKMILEMMKKGERFH